MLSRIRALFIARNKEFYRDRAGFGWNLVFPLFIIIGFWAIFQGGPAPDYKVGVVDPETPAQAVALPESLLQESRLRFIDFADREEAMDTLRHHRIDLVIERTTPPLPYWVNESSPQGGLAEALVQNALAGREAAAGELARQTITGRQIDYIDWLFPGIIAMNMMFSGLYGVGWVIVRYRKNGVLKRLKATPLSAFEFLTAQICSRLVVILFSGGLVYVVSALLLGFHCAGSYFALAFMFALGGVAIISLGVLVAARPASEEFADGVINMISWPMMFLSEVWFSLEGSAEWVQAVANVFPLYHVASGMRRIMNEGATLWDLRVEILVLTLVSAVCLGLGSKLFRWTK
jgi:ABC-type multidrug transport system permease subunit